MKSVGYRMIAKMPLDASCLLAKDYLDGFQKRHLAQPRSRQVLPIVDPDRRQWTSWHRGSFRVLTPDNLARLERRRHCGEREGFPISCALGDVPGRSPPDSQTENIKAASRIRVFTAAPMRRMGTFGGIAEFFWNVGERRELTTRNKRVAAVTNARHRGAAIRGAASVRVGKHHSELEPSLALCLRRWLRGWKTGAMR